MVTVLTFAERANSPAGIKAIDALASAEAAAGKGMVAMVRGLLNVFDEDDAKKLLPVIYMKAAEKRVKGTNAVPVPAEITPQRMSAFRGLFKLKAWDCWSDFLTNMEPRDPAYDTIVMLANWFRHKDTGIAKKGGKAPSADEIEARLTAVKAGKTSKTTTTLADRVKKDPVAALETATDLIGALAAMEGKSKAGAFLIAALKGLNGYAPFVVARAREAAMAKAAAAFDKKNSK